MNVLASVFEREKLGTELMIDVIEEDPDAKRLLLVNARKYLGKSFLDELFSCG